jgi:hypothetical protein
VLRPLYYSKRPAPADTEKLLGTGAFVLYPESDSGNASCGL